MTGRDNRLDYLDQTALELLRATGRRQLMQALWLYERPVDFGALEDFYRRLGAGLLGRLVERSPLPFARARWVAAPPPQPMVVEQQARPRADIMEWADEQTKRPVDPVTGPGFALGVLPLADGGTVVSLVFSHCLVDGGGLALSVYEAVTGSTRDRRYPPARSGSPARSVLIDLRASAGELPRVATALRSLVATARDNAGEDRTRNSKSVAAQHDPGLDRVVDIPSVIVTVDTGLWDARAASLNGNSPALVAAFVARLAESLGRRRKSDGSVALIIAGNGRADFDDDRALAMTFANAVIDPALVTTDLAAARESIRGARERAKNEPDPVAEIWPLVPWFPRRAATAVVDLMFSYADDVPSSCSNMGDLPGVLADVDGTPAELVVARSIDQNVTLRDLVRSRGTLVVVSGRLNGRLWLAVESYELDAENSRAGLAAAVDRTLAEFGIAAAPLSARIE